MAFSRYTPGQILHASIDSSGLPTLNGLVDFVNSLAAAIAALQAGGGGTGGNPESPDQTLITPGGGGPIYDGSGVKYTLTSAGGGRVSINDVPDATTSNILWVIYKRPAPWLLSTTGTWFVRQSGAWAQQPVGTNPFPSLPTTYRLTTAATGTAAIGQTVTAAVTGRLTNPVAVTLSDSGGAGTFSPSAAVLAAATTDASGQSTFIPSGAGTHSISGVNDGYLINPAAVQTVISAGTVPLNYDLYVSVTGNDTTGSGTSAAPFQTISKAASVAVAGRSISVGSGTYAGGFQVNCIGTSSAKIRFISTTKYGANITGGTGVSVTESPAMMLVNGKFCTFEGFLFDGITSPQLGYQVLDEGTSNDYINCRFYRHQTTAANYNAQEASGGAMLCLDGSVGGTGGSVRSCVFDTVGPAGATSNTQHALYVARHNVYAENLTVRNIAGAGFHCWHDVANATCLNSVFDGVRGGAIIIGAYGGTVNTGSIVANNVCYRSTGGISEQGSTGANTFLSNAAFSTTSPLALQTSPTTNALTVTTDPLFINADAGDYHLQSTSPLIDAGSRTNYSLTDVDGTPRTGAGVLPDIGLYEYAKAAYPAQSLQGTTVTTVGPALNDGLGHAFTLFNSPGGTYGLQAAVNGVPCTGSSVPYFLQLLLMWGGVVYAGHTDAPAVWWSIAPTGVATQGGGDPRTGTGSESPNDTELTSVGSGVLTDASGNTMGLANSGNGAIGVQAVINGTVDPNSSLISKLKYHAGKFYCYRATLNQWMVRPTLALSDNWVTVPGDPAVVQPTVTPDGTWLTPPTTNVIRLASGNVYGLVSSASLGYQIAVNGVTDGVTQNVTALGKESGQIYQQNSFGNFYTEASPAGPWTQVSDPRVVVPPPTTTPDGTWYAAPTSSTIRMADGTVYGINASAQITINGTPDTGTSGVAQIGKEGGKFYQLNNAGNFYTQTAPGQAWTQVSDPRVVVPPPQTTTPDGTWYAVPTPNTIKMADGTVYGAATGTPFTGSGLLKNFPTVFQWRAAAGAPIFQVQGGPFCPSYKDWGDLPRLIGNYEQQFFGAVHMGNVNHLTDVVFYDAAMDAVCIRPRIAGATETSSFQTSAGYGDVSLNNVTGGSQSPRVPAGYESSSIVSGHMSTDQNMSATVAQGAVRIIARYPGTGLTFDQRQGMWPQMVHYTGQWAPYSPSGAWVGAESEWDVNEIVSGDVANHGNFGNGYNDGSIVWSNFHGVGGEGGTSVVRTTNDAFHEWISVIADTRWKVYFDGGLIVDQNLTGRAGHPGWMFLVNFTIGGKFPGNVSLAALQAIAAGQWKMWVQSIEIYSLPSGYDGSQTLPLA